MKIKSLQRAIQVAKQIFQNKDLAKDLFNQATQKASDNKGNMETGFWYDIKMLRKMMKAWQVGTFKFSKTAIIYVIAGLVYFVTPIDLVPDFIVGLGFVDDAAVVTLVFKKIKKELEKFKAETRFQDAEVFS